MGWLFDLAHGPFQLVRGAYHLQSHSGFTTLTLDTTYQIDDGWPCTGEVAITGKGELIECTLFRDHEVFGRTIPKGTEIELQSWSWKFDFPEGKAIGLDPDTGELTYSSDSTDAFNLNLK